MTRAEHLQWCKERALALVESGDLQTALLSMSSDLQKHEGTAGHNGVQLGMGLLLLGQLATKQQMTDFIQGFK